MQHTRTIAILPGFGEGSWHTNRLQDALAARGFRRAGSVMEADVIVTHSAGCYFLPAEARAGLIICIDPPYWPERKGRSQTIQKLWQDLAVNARRHTYRFYIEKTIWNLGYIGVNLFRVARIARYASKHNFHEALAHKTVAIIRNDNDTWFSPDAATTLPAPETFSFYRLPGEHDDCWLETEAHAGLIGEIISQSSARFDEK